MGPVRGQRELEEARDALTLFHRLAAPRERMVERGRRYDPADRCRHHERAARQPREERDAARPRRERCDGGSARQVRIRLETAGGEEQNGLATPQRHHDAADRREPAGAVVRHEEEAPARQAKRVQERIIGSDDPGVLPADRGQDRDGIRQTRMVGHDEQRTVGRDVLAPFRGEPSGRVIDDPGRAVPEPALAERAIVRDEPTCELMGEWADEPAHDVHPKTCGAPDERLGTLAGDDVGELPTLGEHRGG